MSIARHGCVGTDSDSLFSAKEKAWKTQTERVRGLLRQNVGDCHEVKLCEWYGLFKTIDFGRCHSRRKCAE